MPLALGIDTSNYTTSVAIVNDQGDVLFDLRQVLAVKKDGVGLRQSEAFYQHVMNLPSLIETIPRDLLSSISAIGVSTRPRPVEGSYMPVFKAGEQFARTLAHGMNLPLYASTHQEGHIAASLIDAPDHLQCKTLSLHASGGTTEWLKATYDSANHRFDIEILGGTKDLSFGQVIDRLGVSLGFSFPCGRAMEEAIQAFDIPAQWQKKWPKAFSIPKDTAQFNLSGWENQAQKAIDQYGSGEAVIVLLFEAIVQTLCSGLKTLLHPVEPMPVVFAGGVMSNQYIQARVKAFLAKEFPMHPVHMGQPALCTDNAVGIAYLTSMKYKSLL